MSLSRRTLISGFSTAAIATLIPRFALSEITLGEATLTTVSDGNLILPGEFIFGPMPQDELAPILSELSVSNTTELTPECNVTLYRDGTNTVLFDVGAGSEFQSSAGLLIDSLAAAGVAPEDITHVVFTHAHPDHIWGLLDDFDDPTFPNASYMIGRTEWDYWLNPETVNTIGEARTTFAVGAKRRLEAIEDMVEFFDGDQEILPNIASVLTPGHTPGHMSFEVRNGSNSALIIGDAIGNHHVAFRKPEWHSGSDQDAELAAETRLWMLDKIVYDNMNVLGFHLPNGGIGRVERLDDGYRFTNETV